MSSTIMEARAIITAEDKTAGAFKAIEARIAALAKSTRALGAATASVARSSGAVANATGPGRLGQIRGGLTTLSGLAAGGTLLGYGSAIAGGAIAKTIVEQGAKRMHERVRMQISGMTAREMADAERESAKLAKTFTPIGQTAIMHGLRNARAIVGSYKEAAEIMEPLLKLRVIAQAARPGEDVGEDFDKLVKGLEIKGVTQHPEQFRSYLEGMAKAVNVFGDTLRPTDYYEMFKYGRQSTGSMSEKYMLGVAPTLAQELGGSSAGTAHAAFFSAIVGGKMSKAALAAMENLDIVDKSKVITPKGGHLANAAGAIKGSDLAAANPYEWVNQVLLPAMHKKGIVDPYKIQEVISSIFSNKVAAQLVGIFATQQSRVEKDMGMIKGAHGLDAAEAIMTRDPVVAFQGLKEAAENLAGALGAVEGLASSMTWLARKINGMIDARNQMDNGGYQRMQREQKRGFFFGAHHDENFLFPHVETNDELYARRRGELTWADGSEAKDAAEIERLKRENANSSPLAWGTRLANNRKIADLNAEIDRIKHNRAALDDINNRHQDVANTRDALDDVTARRRAADPRRMTMYGDVPVASDARSGLNFGLNAGKANWGDYDPSTGAPLPGRFHATGINEGGGHAGDLGQALNGKIEASVKPDQITAELKGEANVNVAIHVEPGSELLKVVQGARSVVSSGNIRANVGGSMPEASAAGRTGGGGD